MSTNEQTFELLEATGLNWTVNKLALTGPEGEATESYGLFRNDNGKWLGTVGPRYTPMQNHELASTIIDACQGVGIEAKRGGQLSGGRRVYLQAALTDEYIGKSGVKRYITALNSHDGSTAIGFGATNQVVICENTFHMAYTSGDLTKFRHTPSAKERINAAMLQLRSALAAEQQLMDNFKRMADTGLKEDMVTKVLERIIKRGFAVEGNEEISTRKRNQLVNLNGAIERELNDEGRTLWGLFNGITRYTNHIAAPKNGSEADRMEYLMSGGGYKLNAIAYEEIMGWIDAHTDESVYVMA